MEMTVQVPFQQLLTLIKSLTPEQKTKLREELANDESQQSKKDDFIEYLLNGPVYSEEEIEVMKESRKSMAAWRMKS